MPPPKIVCCIGIVSNSNSNVNKLLSSQKKIKWLVQILSWRRFMQATQIYCCYILELCVALGCTKYPLFPTQLKQNISPFNSRTSLLEIPTECLVTVILIIQLQVAHLLRWAMGKASGALGCILGSNLSYFLLQIFYA